MSCFRELFSRYPEKVMELCEQEAFDEGRRFCCMPTGKRSAENDPCAMCGERCFDDGIEGSNTSERSECRELWSWYWLPFKEGGGKRRAAFKRLHSKTLWVMPRELRVSAVLAARLLIESTEKANAGKPRLRVAA